MLVSFLRHIYAQKHIPSTLHHSALKRCCEAKFDTHWFLCASLIFCWANEMHFCEIECLPCHAESRDCGASSSSACRLEVLLDDWDGAFVVEEERRYGDGAYHSEERRKNRWFMDRNGRYSCVCKCVCGCVCLLMECCVTGKEIVVVMHTIYGRWLTAPAP